MDSRLEKSGRAIVVALTTLLNLIAQRLQGAVAGGNLRQQHEQRLVHSIRQGNG